MEPSLEERLGHGAVEDTMYSPEDGGMTTAEETGNMDIQTSKDWNEREKQDAENHWNRGVFLIQTCDIVRSRITVGAWNKIGKIASSR